MPTFALLLLQETHRPATVVDVLFSIGLFLVCSSLALSAAGRRARRAVGIFRAAYYLPALPIVLVSANVGLDTSRDPTSHNLWPFEFVIWGVVAAVLYGAVRLAEYLTRRGATPQ